MMDIMCLCLGEGWVALQSTAHSREAPSIAQLGKLPEHSSVTAGLEERC